MTPSLKLSFFGPSGSGKSTALDLVQTILNSDYPTLTHIKLNVAAPLHQIQNFAYKTFSLSNSGQDGMLLQFLATHFENKLGPTFVKTLSSLPHNLVLNSDCRDNAYPYLKKSGFIFIRINTSSHLINKRLNLRSDISSADPNHQVEKITLIIPDFVINNDGSTIQLKQELSHLLTTLLPTSSSPPQSKS